MNGHSFLIYLVTSVQIPLCTRLFLGFVLLGASLGCSAPRQPIPVVLGTVQNNIGQSFRLFSDGTCDALLELPAYTVLVPGTPGGAIIYDARFKQYVFRYHGSSRPLGTSTTIQLAYCDSNFVCWTDAAKNTWAMRLTTGAPVSRLPSRFIAPKAFHWVFRSNALSDDLPWLLIDEPQVIDCWFDEEHLAVLYSSGLLKVASIPEHGISEVYVQGAQIISISDKYALLGDKNMGFAKLGINESQRIRAYEYKSAHLDYNFSLRSRGFVKSGFIAQSAISQLHKN